MGAEGTYVHFEHVETGIVDAYPVGSPGAERLEAESEWRTLDGPDVEEVTVSAAAAKLADENGIDLEFVEGTGANGSIKVSDVKAAIEAADEAGVEPDDGGDPEDE